MGARVRTTDVIVRELEVRAAAGEDVRQQILSTLALSALRAERAAAVARKDTAAADAVMGQILLHTSLVDEVAVDQPQTDSPPAGESRPVMRAGKKRASDAV